MTGEKIVSWLIENWQLFVAAFTLVALLTAGIRMRSSWVRRHFISRINFTLNYIEDNTLMIRTLRESDIDEVLLHNRHGKKVVYRAAKKASLDKPFLEFPKADRWVILNAVLNELSEQFARGFVAASMELPVSTAKFIFGITYERDPRVRLNKIRVMLIEKSLLDRIEEFRDNLKFERESHCVRFNTLACMKEILEDDERKENLLEVELVIEK